MLKKMLVQVLGLVLIFALGCSKKVKPDETEGSSLPPADESPVSAEPMNFNPAGSDSGTIKGLETINFAYDSSALDSAARAKLKTNAAWMKLNSSANVQIEGHCDNRGSTEYNLALGERRAQVVKEYLGSLGIPGSRLSIVSFGKEKLLELGDTEAVHVRNRRANFVPAN